LWHGSLDTSGDDARRWSLDAARAGFVVHRSDGVAAISGLEERDALSVQLRSRIDSNERDQLADAGLSSIERTRVAAIQGRKPGQRNSRIDMRGWTRSSRPEVAVRDGASFGCGPDSEGLAAELAALVGGSWTRMPGVQDVMLLANGATVPRDLPGKPSQAALAWWHRSVTTTLDQSRHRP